MSDLQPRQLASFAVPSQPGQERQAVAVVAEAVSGSGLSPSQLERLKTAVAEATMNAIEHGNHDQAELPVEVAVFEQSGDVVVTISDRGAVTRSHSAPVEPDLEEKLAGLQTPRGWGLFLIRRMVDAMDELDEDDRHTVRLTVRAGSRSEG